MKPAEQLHESSSSGHMPGKQNPLSHEQRAGIRRAGRGKGREKGRREGGRGREKQGEGGKEEGWEKEYSLIARSFKRAGAHHETRQ